MDLLLITTLGKIKQIKYQSLNFSRREDIGNTKQGQNRESDDLIKDIQHGFTKGRSYVTKTNRIFGEKKINKCKKEVKVDAVSMTNSPLSFASTGNVYPLSYFYRSQWQNCH